MIDLTTLIKDWVDQQKSPLAAIDIFSAQSGVDGTPIWADETTRVGVIHDTTVRIFRAMDGSRLDITLQAADPEFFAKLMDALIAAGVFN
jgi:hypothetical protein